MIEEHRHLPDANRLSILAATILLAYALTPFVQGLGREISLPLRGFSFSYTFNLATFVALIVAALAAVGSDWLLRSHPSMGSERSFQHWLLPALTAWVIGVPLNTLAVGPEWWAVFGLGGLLLVLVLVAEYVVVDLSDTRYAPASMGLTAVSFALYLILAITVKASALRLYLMLPALVLALFLVSLRTMYLRGGGLWYFAWSAGIALVVGQLGIGLHYWPLSPLAFGLLLLGPAYALTSMAVLYEEGRSWRSLWPEPVFMLLALWGLAVAFWK